MKFRTLLVLVFLLTPLVAFGQTTAQQDYQEGRAAQFRADHAKNRQEKIASLEIAFTNMAEAAAMDGKYVPAFAEIAHEYIAAGSVPFYSTTEPIARLAKVRPRDPALQRVAAEFAQKYESELLAKGFAPGKPFVQAGKDRGYCSVPYAAENIFHLLQVARGNNSAEAKTWGRYSAALFMKVMKGCGGEGGEEAANPEKAFQIYLAMSDQAGLQKTGKLLGDEWLEKYIFGGTDSRYSYEKSGYQPYYQEAAGYYKVGGVPKSEIRSEILRLLRRAEKENDTRSAGIAQKLLAGSF